jgi:hypothetical protein
MNYCYNEGDTFWDALSLEMRGGSTIMLQKANVREWKGNLWHHQWKRSLKLNHWWEKWYWHFWMHKANFGTLSREGHNSKLVHYCEMLQNLLKPAIQTNCRRLLSKYVSILHNNAHSYTAATTESLVQQNSEVLKHPPCDPGSGSVTSFFQSKVLWEASVQ